MDFQRLWPQRSLNKLAIRRASQAILATGRALPCEVVSVSGAIVTVKFEVDASPWTLPQITIPKAESPWIRMPTQAGDLGWTVPADAYLGGVSGLGGGTADLSVPGNLSALVFMPISNENSAPIDGNKVQLIGPDGVLMQTQDASVSINMDVTAGSITFVAGGKTVVLDSSGLTIDGILFDTHRHTGVTGGAADSGGPI